MQEGTPHRILRLPPYHYFWNPIELVWSDAKRYYDKHIKNRINQREGKAKIADISEEVWREAIAQVTPEKWCKYVDHCEKLILEAHEKEIGTNPSPKISPIIIFLGNPGDDRDSDEDISVPVMEVFISEGQRILFNFSHFIRVYYFNLHAFYFDRNAVG